MNEAMDSRVEALAFQYVSLGLFTVTSNLWTLVAVVTAAVSVWSIKAVAGSSAVRRRRREPKPATPCGDGGAIGRSNGGGSIPEQWRPADVAEVPAPAAAADGSSVASAPVDHSGIELADGVTKGRRKFTAYYNDDAECEEAAVAATEADEEEEEGAWEGGSCGAAEWWESWERVLTARNGEMCWYRCQDTGVLSGAVVRLWDDSRCRGGRRDSSVCAVW